jgi:hypothetical protein
LVLFGGYADSTYLADLHTIDVETGEVALVKTEGEGPSGRTTPVVEIRDNKFYVWGGFHGDYPSDLHVLDFATMEWSRYPQQVAGRTAVPHVVAGDTLYIYGGSKTGGMLCLNFDTLEFTTRETMGVGPPTSVRCARMVNIGRYLFYFGGKMNNEWSLMYACDLVRMWWFIFPIVPDGETVSVADGSVNDLGLFRLPQLESFSMIYVPETRQIMAFLGHPEKDPPRIFVVSCAEALGVINLREDMSDALKD